MRYLLCLMIAAVGCVATIPSDDALTADIACETARMVTQLRNEIKPTPTPDSGDCENCVDGFIGDGKIKITCPVCKGTGKK